MNWKSRNLAVIVGLLLALIITAKANGGISAQSESGDQTAVPTGEATGTFLTVEGVFAGVHPTQKELADLKQTYTQQWMLQELNSWSDDQLEVAKLFAYDFLATTPEALAARKARSEDYLQTIGIQTVLVPADGTKFYKTQADIDAAVVDQTLTTLPQTLFKLRNSRDVLIVDARIAPQVIAFSKYLGDKSQLLWGTSSARSAAEQEALRKLGYPAAPVAWGISPNMRGLSFGVAITDFKGTGGVYDKFLEGLDQSGLAKISQCIKEGQQAGATICYPTFASLIKMGAITDSKFIDLYNAMNNAADFQLIDLTGIYSISIHDDGSFELGTINPAFLLVSKTALPVATPAATAIQ